MPIALTNHPVDDQASARNIAKSKLLLGECCCDIIVSLDEIVIFEGS